MAERIVFEYRVVDTPERPWAGAGDEPPTIERKEVSTVTTGTQYEGAVSYRIGNRISERLVLGPVTAGQIIIIPPGSRKPSGWLPEGFHIISDDDSITVNTAHTVYFNDGSPSQLIPTGGVSSLASGQKYGLYWRDGDGFEAELYPAPTHDSDGQWIFLGWWSTSTGGVFPTPPTRPPGYGGDGPAAVFS